MSYATFTSVITMLPGLPQSATTTTEAYTITTNLITQHLTRAYNLINTKLSKKYAAPFTTTNIPPMCTSLEEDIASYYTMRSLYTRDAQNDASFIVEHYDRAITILDELSECKLDLLDANGAQVGFRVSSADKFQTTTDFPPVFELDSVTSWAVSTDRLDDVETERDE